MQDSLADLDGPPVESYLVAHDKRTGDLKWRTVRKTEAKAEECDAYTTPIVRKVGDHKELVVMGGNQLDAYDPDSGRQLWYLTGLVGGRTVTGPTVADGLVFATRGMKKPMVAVKPDGSGELSEKAIAWQATQDTADASSPVVWKGLLFFTTDGGFVQCYDVKTGEQKWKERCPATTRRRRSPPTADVFPQPGWVVYGDRGVRQVREAGRQQPRRRHECVAGRRRRTHLYPHQQGAILHRGEVAR